MAKDLYDQLYENYPMVIISRGLTRYVTPDRYQDFEDAISGVELEYVRKQIAAGK